MVVVKDLIAGKKAVITTKKTVTLDEIVQTMVVEDIHRLPVVDDEGNCVGIITDQDVRVTAGSPIIGNHNYSDLMKTLHKYTVDEATQRQQRGLILVEESTPVVNAAQLLMDHHIGGVPVVQDGTSKVVGVLTRTDLIKHLIQTLQS